VKNTNPLCLCNKEYSC